MGRDATAAGDTTATAHAAVGDASAAMVRAAAEAATLSILYFFLYSNLSSVPYPIPCSTLSYVLFYISFFLCSITCVDLYSIL